MTSKKVPVANCQRLQFSCSGTSGRAGPLLSHACRAHGGAVRNLRPAQSPRTTLNFNLNWKFIRQDVPGAEAPTFDDAKWDSVATPHSYNDVDSFRKLISHGGGDTAPTRDSPGIASTSSCPRVGRQPRLPGVRRHAPGGRHLPQRQAGRPVRERRHRLRHRHHRRVRPAARRTCSQSRWTTPPLQGTRLLRRQPEERQRHSLRRRRAYEWNANDFNPDHGGINRHVWLHVTGKIHQTLPLYYGLESQRRLHARCQLRHPEEDGRHYR